MSFKTNPRFLVRLSLWFTLLFAATVRLQGQPVDVMGRIPLMPTPRTVVYHGKSVPFPSAISVHGLGRARADEDRTVETMEELFRLMPEVKADFGGRFPYKIVFEASARIKSREGYELSSDESGVIVRYGTEAGRFYGAQTVYQLFAYAYCGARFLLWENYPAESQRCLPVLTIVDEPAYAIRAFMADAGRAPFSLPLLKRLVRLMAQVKLNTLHLRLYDDELCGFHFAYLPLGQENPTALDAAGLRELVHYARGYHVTVMPELESWGHVQSIIYHYPHLRGAAGTTGGSSFGIGEPTYALLEQIYDEIVPCLGEDAAVHVGLDEAVWAVLAGEENRGHTPTNMVDRIHQILQRVAARHHVKVTMHLWADHGGRPLSKELEPQVIIEPWAYLEANQTDIVDKLAHYGGAGKAALMMGAGIGWGRTHGDFEATRIWCTEGQKYPNVRGVTLCLWGTNDVAGRLITLYAGAGFAWAPEKIVRDQHDRFGELLRNRLDLEMQRWQLIFPAADPDAINADRGPEVLAARYLRPPLAGKPVAPTVDFKPPQAHGPGSPR